MRDFYFETPAAILEEGLVASLLILTHLNFIFLQDNVW